MEGNIKRPGPSPLGGSHGGYGRSRSRILGWVALGIAVIVLAVVIFFGASLITKTDASGSGIKKNQYQAVFLTNGQVYFGKISKLDNGGVTLNNIYYLQVQQGVQPDTKAAADANQQLSLAKLGSELHAPEDTMFINRDQLLFWENLKDDGKVVQAIKSQTK